MPGPVLSTAEAQSLVSRSSQPVGDRQQINRFLSNW